MSKLDNDITATVRRETSRLTAFIKKRVRDVRDAEDILQDVLLELVRMYHLPEPVERVGSWLFRVARNRIIDRYRKGQSRASDAQASLSNDEGGAERLDLLLPTLDADPESALSRSILLEALQEAVEELPESQRAVFVAHEIDGLSFKEIAQKNGESINTLLGRKRYAVLYLRGRLQPIYDELNL